MFGKMAVVPEKYWSAACRNTLSIASFQRVIETANVQAIKTLVRNNQGISFLYEAAAREEIEKGELEVIDLYDSIFSMNLITLH